jgi:hypothetical protein
MSKRLLAVALMCMAMAWDAYAAEPATPVSPATQPSTPARAGRGARGAATQPGRGGRGGGRGQGAYVPATRPSTLFTFTIDTTGAPDLTEWAETKLRPVIQTWYPIICELIPSEGYTPPKQFTINIADRSGVASTSGTRINVSAAWIRQQTARPGDWNEAIGSVVHEAVHVAQQYRGGNPVWMTEGMTDYIRWFKYEPVDRRPKLRSPETASYTQSYQQTAGFINWVVKTYDPEFSLHLNEACRERRYTPESWKEYTGKSLDDLWAEYVKWSIDNGNVATAARGGGGGRGRGATTQPGRAGGME